MPAFNSLLYALLFAGVSLVFCGATVAAAWSRSPAATAGGVIVAALFALACVASTLDAIAASDRRRD